MLFRIALAIFKLLKKELMSLTDPSDLRNTMESI